MGENFGFLNLEVLFQQGGLLGRDGGPPNQEEEKASCQPSQECFKLGSKWVSDKSLQVGIKKVTLES